MSSDSKHVTAVLNKDSELWERYRDWQEDYSLQSSALKAALREATTDDHEPTSDSGLQGVADGLVGIMVILLGETLLTHGLLVTIALLTVILGLFGLSHAAPQLLDEVGL